MKLVSIIIPIYNEFNTIIKLLNIINDEIKKIDKYKFEVILVDDHSSDNSINLIKQNSHLYNKLIINDKNYGKGHAVRKGIYQSNGEIILIQDADLEYLPENYLNLLKPFDSTNADVVYGSRFRTTHSNRVLFFWHYVANTIITFLSNCFTNLNFSDVEVGYKLFKRDIFKNINLIENSFSFEIEVTHKISRIKPKLRIFEVGISYYARDYSEGKKIGFKDAIIAVYCILKYGFKLK